MRRQLFAAALACLLCCATAFAQGTTGSITGRVTDQQGAAVPGATVTAKSGSTGFVRTETSDAEGIYRLNALPVGKYDVVSELSGFTSVSKKDVDVNVGVIVALDFSLKVAAVAETVTVTGATPLINVTNAAVGGIVDPKRIESIPLNGRQFANLAATIPGVGLAFHTDPTKSTQYSPQINGGNGRNINYQIDGGDNNDDTVGGLLQQFPLEAIQEFNFQTQRFKAEYGRSNGGVLNVVTKSGTNTPSGSVFEFFRDKSMNALSESEMLANPASPTKGDYRRNQFGGSFGGPIILDKVHFFGAIERTQQDTTQVVDTLGLFPDKNGTFAVPYRENLVTVKATANLNSSQYLTVRYGFNNNSQPYGAARLSTFDNWGDSSNKFHSINLNHNTVLGGAKLNEFIFQFANFRNNIASRCTDPTSCVEQSFPNRVTIGANGNTPQTTEQEKFQFRDDFSWHATGHGGLGHDFKVGASFINEPHLFITFNTGKGAVFYTHVDNTINGPIQTVTISDGDANANIPTRQFATYMQDDWRVSDRLTLNLGLRYDIVTGISSIDQTKNPNYIIIRDAARAGKFNSLPAPVADVLNHFASDPQSDRNNVQPRIGAVYNVHGDGKDIIRGGWGMYTDFGYTNSNVLFAAADASGTTFGNVLAVGPVTTGIKKADGTLFHVGDPLSTIQSQNASVGTPPFGQWVDPLLQMPMQYQTNAGWSHELDESTVIGADMVYSLGRDLNTRPRVNQRFPGSLSNPRMVSSVVLPAVLNPNNQNNRPATSVGKSEYDALILSLRHRLSHGVDFTVGYVLARSRSNIGTAVDQLNTANIQDPTNPYDAPVQFGPTTDTDARHRINLSASFDLPGGFRVAPVYLWRSALPVGTTDGRDRNLDGDATDIPDRAFAVDSFDSSTGITTVKDIGACTTVNCGRGMSQQQMNLRVSKVFAFGPQFHAEVIGEVFNVFNTINPSVFNTRYINPTTGALDTTFLQPTTFSGDFRRPEQRVGQIGLRFSF